MKSIFSMAVSFGVVLLLAPVSALMAGTAFVLVQYLWPGCPARPGTEPKLERDKFSDGERMAREALGKLSGV